MTPKPTLMLDLEVYKNYFLAGFLNVDTGNVRQIEAIGAEGKLSSDDVDVINRILEAYRVVGFNSGNYDMPILGAALKGATCEQLKAYSDKIIQNNLKPWQIGLEPPRCDHIDLFDVAPGMASLKIYGGRLHCKRMQDLPIHEAALISPEQRELLRTYNANDLTTTKDLWNHLQPQLDLREQMSKVYQIDLRSKSDAQIAEAVIVKEVSKSLGEAVQRPEVPGGTRFKYVPPKFLHFQTPAMREIHKLIAEVEFLVTDGGTVQMPEALKKRDIPIGAALYRMGIGGLHSQESQVSYYADDETEISDIDGTSYYPEIILGQNIAPPHMGAAFMKVFKGFKVQRVAAKKAGLKSEADALKITTNGAGGKLNSKWSKLYYPQGFIHMTVTGQLSLLMMIERLEAAGIQVVSANTDGVTVVTPKTLSETRDAIVRQWESETGFPTEQVFYRSIHFRDVNSYVTIKDDGKFKLKGAFAMESLCPALGGGLMTNPSNEICIEAVAYFLRDRTSIEQTIRSCTDIRKLITIRQVNGGAVDQQGAYLGKAVRWYYAKGIDGPLKYAVNGYTVARSDGARACMELPDELPTDVDFGWYETEARSILADLGVDHDAYLVRDLV